MDECKPLAVGPAAEALALTASSSARNKRVSLPEDTHRQRKMLRLDQCDDTKFNAAMDAARARAEKEGRQGTAVRQLVQSEAGEVAPGAGAYTRSHFRSI